MASLTQRLQAGVDELGRRHNLPLRATRASHLFFLHWNQNPIKLFEDHYACAIKPLAHISRTLFDRGIYVGYQGRGCVSAAHEERHIDEFLAGVEAAILTL
jgi:glutamate-1-semialdehyde aminotransferase